MRARQRRGQRAWRLIRQLVVGAVGGVVTATGIALCFVPGPGLLVLLFGLTILAIEFVWAREARAWLQRKIRAFRRRFEMTRKRPARPLR